MAEGLSKACCKGTLNKRLQGGKEWGSEDATIYFLHHKKRSVFGYWLKSRRFQCKGAKWWGPPKVSIDQSHFTWNASAITSWLLDISHLSSLKIVSRQNVTVRNSKSKAFMLFLEKFVNIIQHWSFASTLACILPDFPFFSRKNGGGLMRGNSFNTYFFEMCV